MPAASRRRRPVAAAAGRRSVGIGEHAQIGHRQCLVVHAPASMDVAVERAVDDGGGGQILRQRRPGARRKQAGNVLPVEADDEIGGGRPFRPGVGRPLAHRRESVQAMLGGKHRGIMQRGQHRGPEALGEFDAAIPVSRGARAAPEQQHRRFRGAQQLDDAPRVLATGRRRMWRGVTPADADPRRHRSCGCPERVRPPAGGAGLAGSGKPGVSERRA